MTQRGPNGTLPFNARFWLNVAPGRADDECWLWEGVLDKDGYGLLRNLRAHRVAYELERGPIPPGLDLDHLCRSRACVNPAHLEPVTNRVNSLRGAGATAVNVRKTHCVRGHELDANARLRPDGRRECRPCRTITQRARRARRKQ